jgi:hypothetical protein
MKIKADHWIIHAFALLHAGVALLCAALDMRDSLLLTALTMTLAGIICFRSKMTVEITVTSLILVNIVGFVLGNAGALAKLEAIPVFWRPALTTFAVTEIIGWALYAFAHRLTPYGAAAYERDQSWYRNAGWLVVAVALIFAIRVYTDLNYSGNFILENSGVMILLIFTTLVSLVFMMNFALQMQRETSAQRTRRHQAEFRYMNLKNQVNPHFLFNSLNVLDSIVLEGTPQEASAYIHKLASIYRYLMQHEAKKLVPLSEEIQFARTYRELIQIRFPEGLVLEDRVGADIPHGYIIPCTLQLLLENAIKHNAISPENPLIVSVFTDGKSITMRNTRIPKVSTRPSTGIGLQYIRNQYRDLADAEITVTQTLDSFAVTVPILEDSK